MVENACETITKEQLSRLFDRFYRADASRAGDGYGIGLSIAKAIVVAHKGKIQARTADGKSLTVTVALPTARTQRL